MTMLEDHLDSIEDNPEAMTAFARAAGSPQGLARYAIARGLRFAPGEAERFVAAAGGSRSDVPVPDHALDGAGSGFLQDVGKVLEKAFTEPPKRYDTPEEWHRAHRGQIVTTIPTIWGDRY